MDDLFINRRNHLADYGISERAARALSCPSENTSRIEWHNLDSDNPELFIYEQIGFDWMSGQGVSAVEFAEQLKALSGKDLTVRINSPGGDVFDGVSIYNQLTSHDGKVHVIIDGIAASAASIIAMAGDKISMAETSQLMIHDSWTMAVGNEHDMREIAEVLERIDGQIAAVYAARTGRRASTWREIMNKDTYFTPEEAVDAKLADEILKSNKRRPKAETTAEPRQVKGSRLPLIKTKLRGVAI